MGCECPSNLGYSSTTIGKEAASARSEEEDDGVAALDALLDTINAENNMSLSRTLHKLVNKPRILVCAPSNAACNVLLEVHISFHDASEFHATGMYIPCMLNS